MLISRKKADNMSPIQHINIDDNNLPNNSREMRNRAEKMRRDKLNSYIGELATLVPIISKSSKKMDKTSILRLTATHLRIYQTLISSKHLPHVEMPKQIDQSILEQIVCKELGGFMLILTTNGKIIFVSSTVENLLGYLQTDLLGQSIYSITSQNDHDKLRTYLNSYGDLELRWRKYFNVSIKRAGPRSETPVYENVRIMSVHRPFNSDRDCNQNTSSSNELTTTTSSTTTTTMTNNGFLVLFIRVNRTEPISHRLLDASKNEYVTRHLVDGLIINCDHRISLIAGYMTDEVSGFNAFKYMHKEDVRWVMIALRQMYDRGETKGSSCYRLLSRNNKFIYLKTSGFLEVDDQGTVESFICVNTLVDENEGRQLIEEMKKRYSAYVNCTISSSMSGNSHYNSECVEDPIEIEQAVKDLIKNLPPPGLEICSTTTTTTKTATTNKLNNYEKKDCYAHSTDISNGNIKTVMKRPPSTDLDTNHTHKRPKTTTSRYSTATLTFSSTTSSASNTTTVSITKKKITQDFNK